MSPTASFVFTLAQIYPRFDTNRISTIGQFVLLTQSSNVNRSQPPLCTTKDMPIRRIHKNEDDMDLNGTKSHIMKS